MQSKGVLVMMEHMVSFKDANFDSFTSDCSLAAHHIENSLGNIQEPEHPISLIKKAYGIRA